MHIHILGICGTFMGGLALLAKELGYQVSGSDSNVYPPMSTQLEAQGIRLCEGYRAEYLQPQPDLVVVGNAMSRGNPAVEYVLDNGLAYTSGPQWLAEHVLQSRWVLAVAGTHGKTTTASILAWLLQANGLEPGFLIGGIPGNFAISARLGKTPFFIVEADEYDTAFFDKRSKFVHYRPRTLILNNLEFDHADIFKDLEAIKVQFHHLMRIVPGNGLVVSNGSDENLHDVISRGCWTDVETFSTTNTGQAWNAQTKQDDNSQFTVFFDQQQQGQVNWSMIGEHNMGNALAAIAAARHAGVPAPLAIEALSDFSGIKRRLEVRGEIAGITVYDDFAHHPTAIAMTLAGLRKRVGTAPIIAILEPRSNTMRMGIHADSLAQSLQQADHVLLSQPAGIDWDMAAVVKSLGEKAKIFDTSEAIIKQVVSLAAVGSHVLIMSNGGFDNIHQRLLDCLGQGKNENSAVESS